MTAMNIVHMRVKPGHEAEFIALHKELNASLMEGMRNFWLTKVGETSYCVVGEWTDMEALVKARPTMIASLDKIRPVLEDLGGGRGITEPYSGQVAFHTMP
jgi:quinol monooxygenase YgiN